MRRCPPNRCACFKQRSRVPFPFLSAFLSPDPAQAAIHTSPRPPRSPPRAAGWVLGLPHTTGAAFLGSAPAPLLSAASPPRDGSVPSGRPPPPQNISSRAQKGDRCPRAERPALPSAHSRGRPPARWLFGGSQGSGPAARGCRARSPPATPCPCPPGGTPAAQSPGVAGGGCGHRAG